MDYSNLIAGGAIGGILLGAIVSLWGKIKGLMWKFCSYFIAYVEIKDEETAKAVLTHLVEYFKRSRIQDRTYGGCYEFTRDGRYGLIPYEFMDKTIVFWLGWRPLVYGVAKTATSNNSSGNFYNNSTDKSCKTLMFLRGSFDIEEIFKKAVSDRNQVHWNSKKESTQRRFFIRKVPNAKGDNNNTRYSVGNSIAWYNEGGYRLLQHKQNELGRSQGGNRKALDMLIFPQRIKNLIREIQIWRNHREWYVERCIPWKRGWILYGPPGGGKSALVRAFAEDEDMPLFIFSLGELMNPELQRSWEDMQSHIPCIALFEDIDNVFHGRENVWGRNINYAAAMMLNQQEQPQQGQQQQQQQDGPPKPKLGGTLSFDCLLNCIDGADKNQGVFTVITTNHIEHIDEALGKPQQRDSGELEFISSRPGRIDKAIELTFMEPSDKREMAQRILGEYEEGLREVLMFIDRNLLLQETPAQFQERCSQVALTYFWKEIERKEKHLENGFSNH